MLALITLLEHDQDYLHPHTYHVRTEL
jgi:hypothetical protein